MDGAPAIRGELRENRQRQKQIPPLRCGMTNKKTGMTNKQQTSSRQAADKQQME